ncbi:MAG: rRNA pseudouridine synthase [Verrucomicrobia bacterium]|nr:rRNA pseudouridine synthase [Verrucomicrobiota bacterium]
MARILSKWGVCSRSEAWAFILAGRVALDGRVVRDPEHPVQGGGHDIRLDGKAVRKALFEYFALNKPRGYVCTSKDEKGRDTIFSLLGGAGIGHLGLAGRLDQASEGLLLLTNDTAWANGIAHPHSRVEKRYHVQVRGKVGLPQLKHMEEGLVIEGERLRAVRASYWREGRVNCWLEIVLDEGKNRQIRRMLEAGGFEVLRLVRVAIGPVQLGSLAKGAWRRLTAEEVRGLGRRKA